MTYIVSHFYQVQGENVQSLDCNEVSQRLVEKIVLFCSLCNFIWVGSYKLRRELILRNSNQISLLIINKLEELINFYAPCNHKKISGFRGEGEVEVSNGHN